MLINKDYLPTTKQESWKYTNLAAIYDKHGITKIFQKSPQATNHLDKFNIQKNEIIIIDGISIINDKKKLVHSANNLEFNKDTREMSRLAIENSFKHFLINIAQNTKDNLSLIFVSTDDAKNKLTNIALKLNVDTSANLNLNIDFVNLTEKSAINLFLDINVANSAKINFTSNINHNSANLLATANYLLNLDKNAEFNAFNLLHDGVLLRNDFLVNLNDECSRFDTRGGYLANKQTIANACFLINHKASRTYSNINFRGIVSGSAKIWFNAKTVINKSIKQIQAYQNNKNIQLSKESEINTKPELVIYSDDIICNHGATVGKLDKEILFYLQSRGLSLCDAQHLLLKNFIKSQLVSDDFNFHNKLKTLNSLDNIVENFDWL